MKVFLVIISLFLTTLSHAADKDGKFAIKGVGNSSCRNFLELSGQASLNKFLYAGWLNGYLTAQNQHLNKTFDLTSWETIHTLGEYLRNYCEKNLDKSFYIAVASMVNGLFDGRVQTFSPTEAFGAGKDGIKIYQYSLARAQSKLKKLGFYKGKVDGKNTDETQRAIKAFQKKKKFLDTGIPDQQTLHALLVQK
ncbi:MAG: peptidoglycan-binding protein [Nitrospiria bacterium]